MSPVTIDLSDEVRAALADGGAVVALESTIISHGFPHPENLALAGALEDEVRAAGAVPATIAIIDGRLTAGLDTAALERLALGPAVKCTTRDLAPVMAAGGLGATTVAATAWVAAHLGIAVFATGGIGGVHRTAPGEAAFDVSADLLELARTPVAVISAGAKSILDLPATLEVLESYGVPVIGYRTDDFPAFHARSSGLPVPHRADDVAGLARIVACHRDLGIGSAMLVCNPPPEEIAFAREDMEAMVGDALAAASAAGISGPASTPFLLAHLHHLSGGRTSVVNRGLAISNAALGAQLAVALAGLASGKE
ncbi:pseudouridine-5'-phosphate glycosidase [Oceanibacterium hippocampi]|uniref:Pseudouridine-5'-phosphate glycosidase n=1 Tax=Oceanibacterium hippocampi TaxID=745714 RepID=A0A1Y5SLH5_9PROT|nr:pseudouridine-5'-phosphate glycosidase [Oceanibacterium hippocampi]SLN43561.1 Pseudouridine-5'-phosphate glycosidase [Oceanibacterium hippocampi]